MTIRILLPLSEYDTTPFKKDGYEIYNSSYQSQPLRQGSYRIEISGFIKKDADVVISNHSEFLDSNSRHLTQGVRVSAVDQSITKTYTTFESVYYDDNNKDLISTPTIKLILNQSAGFIWDDSVLSDFRRRLVYRLSQSGNFTQSANFLDITKQDDYTIVITMVDAVRDILIGSVVDILIRVNDGYLESKLIQVSTGITVTNNDSNAILSPIRSFEQGETVTFTLTPKDGYMYETLPVLTDGTNTYTFTDNGNDTYSLTLTLTNNLETTVLAVQYVTITYNCTNCTCNYPNGQRFKKGGIWPNGNDVIKVTPFNNYKFNETQYFSYNQNTYPFTENSEFGYIYISPLSSTIQDNISFECDAILTYDKLGFIAIYNPSSSQMNELAGKRFFDFGGSNFIDYSPYILSLVKLYIDIDNYGTQLVYYGGYNTEIRCNTIPTDRLEIDCGHVVLTEKYNNSIDYNNADIELYLPYLGVVKLEPYKYMNRDIGLKYYVNPINGDFISALYLYSSIESNIEFIDIFKGNLAFKVPINQNNADTIPNSLGLSYNDNANYLINDLTPRITVWESIPMDKPLKGIAELRNGVISTFSGECQFIDCDLSPNGIPKDEFEMIITELVKGVIL